MNRITHNSLELDIESGVGVQGEREPIIVLDWSDDGGKTWSNQLSRSMGKIGEFKKRAIWTRLGTSNKRNYRFFISDPVKRVITGGSINVSTGGK